MFAHNLPYGARLIGRIFKLTLHGHHRGRRHDVHITLFAICQCRNPTTHAIFNFINDANLKWMWIWSRLKFGTAQMTKCGLVERKTTGLVQTAKMRVKRLNCSPGHFEKCTYVHREKGVGTSYLRVPSQKVLGVIFPFWKCFLPSLLFLRMQLILFLISILQKGCFITWVSE